MKKVLLGGVALITLGLAGSAFAADMPVKAPPVAETNTWTGFYIGVDFGGIYGLNNTQSFRETGNYQNPACFFGCFDPVTFNNPTNWGETGGVHIGYNWQLSPSWVVGGEVDWNKTALGNTPGQLFLTIGGGPLPACVVGTPGCLPWPADVQQSGLDRHGARQDRLHLRQRDVLCHGRRRLCQRGNDGPGRSGGFQHLFDLDIEPVTSAPAGLPAAVWRSWQGPTCWYASNTCAMRSTPERRRWCRARPANSEASQATATSRGPIPPSTSSAAASATSSDIPAGE